MEILQFLLSFFLKEFGGEKWKPLFALLKENDFSLKGLLSNLSPQTIAPIIQAFMGGFERKESPEERTSAERLNPITSFADYEILKCLNNYFSQSG